MSVAHNSGGVYMPIESLDSMFSHIEITPIQLIKNHQISGLSLQNYWWILIVLLITVKFLNPKKSILSKPNDSKSFMSACVATSLVPDC